MRLPKISSRLRSLQGPSVWVEFSPLARLTSAINLGQGAPGWGSPPFLKRALEKAAASDAYSQYASPTGAPILTAAIAKQYASRIAPPREEGGGGEGDDEEFDPGKQIVITVGASQAIVLACNSFLSEGDEAILIEPSFDMYGAAVRLAGGKPVFVPLVTRGGEGGEGEGEYFVGESGDLELDMGRLEAAISPRTRMLILNTPHNPTGKVFTREELRAIADLLDAKGADDVVVLSDEVYEHLVFDGREHVPFASVSRSAYARTVSVYSAGKTFSATGLKVGWAVGPAELVGVLQRMQQFGVFSVCHVAQAAVAEALTVAEGSFAGFGSYYEWLRAGYEGRRDVLVTVLQKAGMRALRPEGAFYVCARVPEGHRARGNDGGEVGLPTALRRFVETGRLCIDEATVGRGDYNVARRLVIRWGVACIPVSAFFEGEDGESPLAKYVVRFAFCHPEEVLREAGRRLMGDGKTEDAMDGL